MISLLSCAGLGACSSDSTRGSATAYSDVNASTGPGIASQHVALETPVTVQAGDVCTKGGPVQITKVEPNTVIGKLRVTAWGTRYQRNGDEGGGSDPASAHTPLASLGGFTHAAFTQPCGTSATAHRELNVEVKAGTSAARATTFTVTYNGGRTFIVPIEYARCTGGVTANFTCIAGT